MQDERFQGAASKAQLEDIRAEWERTHGPLFLKSLGAQQDAIHDMFGYTGKVDPRELSNAEARLYLALLKARPAYQAPSAEKIAVAWDRF